MTLNEYAMFDKILLDEINVKKVVRYVATTEKGDLYLVFDGEKYFFEMDGKDVTTPKLLDIAPRILEESFNRGIIK